MGDIKEKLKLLPDLPGCYLMKDKTGKIIYVGKAKNLKNRVRSYFHGAHNAKTTKLVSEIDNFEYIVTKNELESFVLEINLIKQHDPKYNIMLTDDKTYPYIALTNEENPRLIVTRNTRKKKNAKYFGPYPNVASARKTVDMLNMIYHFRKCSFIPNKECLYFHMHACYAPCINKGVIDYTKDKEAVISFLNGNTEGVLKELTLKMEEASNNLEFERAMEFRDLINDIRKTTEKQNISINDFSSKDIVGLYITDEEIAVHILIMRNGSIVQNEQTNFTYVGSSSEAINSYLLMYYENEELRPKEIIISNVLDLQMLNEALKVNVFTPQKGQKKELLEMANANAKKDLENKFHIYQNKVLKKIETIENLGKLLNINPPYYLEAFDNSNLFGEYPVSAMVVYRNGRPSPKDYRKYHVKTVTGANDYATMKEVIYRRYLRLLMEDKPMPDLIIMDGGEIQVHACLETLASLNVDIPVMGIQKDEHHVARIIYYNDHLIEISKNSDIYLLLANISQSVHDFAIRFFRSTKTKGIFYSRLDNIKGLGPKGKAKLLQHFITIDKIKTATIEEIKSVGISEGVAKEIIKHLNDDEEKKDV